MMKKTLILALAATFCLSGTAQQRKGTVRKTTGTTAKTTVINFTATGELGLFDLRGSVKECVWTTKDQTRKLGFDRKGMWISEGNGKPWDNYGSVKRDSKGRIIQMGDGEESGELFTYNANGLMTKHVTVYMDGRDVATYTYNSKGECTKETFSYGDMYGSGKNVAIFTIIARDSQGNWTKRKTQKGNVETRQISYYEVKTPIYLSPQDPKPITKQEEKKHVPENPRNPENSVTPENDTIPSPRGYMPAEFNIIVFASQMIQLNDFSKIREQALAKLFKPSTDKDKYFTAERTIGKKENIHTDRFSKKSPKVYVVSTFVSDRSDDEIISTLKRLGYVEGEVKNNTYAGALAVTQIYRHNSGTHYVEFESVQTSGKVFKELKFKNN